MINSAGRSLPIVRPVVQVAAPSTGSLAPVLTEDYRSVGNVGDPVAELRRREASTWPLSFRRRNLEVGRHGHLNLG